MKQARVGWAERFHVKLNITKMDGHHAMQIRERCGSHIAVPYESFAHADHIKMRHDGW